MLYLIFTSIFIAGLAYILLDRALKTGTYKYRRENLEKLDKIYNDLIEQKKKLNSKVRSLSKELESTIGFYEVTKDVCSSLKEEEVFEIFRDKLKTILNIKDCLFIKKPQIDYAAYKGDFVFKVRIDAKTVGFLIAKGIIKKEDEEILYILTQQFLLGLKRARFYRRVQELSITDSLTQLLNRRYFLERLDEEINRAREFNLEFSFLMVDIDHFKDYNDRFGHLAGDIVLRQTSRIIKKSTRQIDLVGRYGGEEFSILLPETSKQGAYLAAERIRKSLEAKKIKAYDESLNVTISIGLCSFPKDAKTEDEIIDKADLALYQAKNKGRNQVCICQ